MVLGSVWQQRTVGACLPRGGQRGDISSPYRTSSTVRSVRRVVPSIKLLAILALLIAWGALGEGAEAVAQTPKKGQPLDTIILTSGNIKIGTLKNIFGDNVYYVDTLGKEHSLQERNVHRIIYSNGRSQTLNQKAVSEVSEDDWRIVMLVDDPAKVEGLYARGVVSGKSSPSNKSKRSAQRSAETRIKKRCVAKGGIVVLITKRLTTGGYGETPSYYIEGEAYGSEPLEEGTTGDEDSTDSGAE